MFQAEQGPVVRSTLEQISTPQPAGDPTPEQEDGTAAHRQPVLEQGDPEGTGAHGGATLEEV